MNLLETVLDYMLPAPAASGSTSSSPTIKPCRALPTATKRHALGA